MIIFIRPAQTTGIAQAILSGPQLGKTELPADESLSTTSHVQEVGILQSIRQAAPDSKGSDLQATP